MTASEFAAPPWFPTFDPFDGNHFHGVAAEAYGAVLGWPVVPLWGANADGSCRCPEGCRCPQVGDHPVFLTWAQLATTNRETIRTWFARLPLANVGILTGPSSGLIVVPDPVGGKRDGALPPAIPEGPVFVDADHSWFHLFHYPAQATTDPKRVSFFAAPPSRLAHGRVCWVPERHPLRVAVPPLPDPPVSAVPMTVKRSLHPLSEEPPTPNRR